MTHAVRYQCPGENYEIGRVIHLGRLANYFPSCRQCPHAHDTAGLPTALAERVNQANGRTPPNTLFTAEGMAGVVQNEFTAAAARQAAAALGVWLRETRSPESEAPRVVIAGDARPLTPELLAAASDGLRWAGCHVTDVGALTAAALTWALVHLRADGGLLIGNPGGEPRRVGVKMWGPSALPLSAGDRLDDVRRLYEQPLNRPTRASGELERAPIESAYIETLAHYFHALRPLRVVLETASPPLLRFVSLLGTRVACQIRSGRIGGPGTTAPADFRYWVDGDGESCRLFYGGGAPVPSEWLLLLLAGELLADGEGAIVLEEQTPDWVAERLRAAGAQVWFAPSTRSAMSTAMRAHGAVLGAGPSGRYWFDAIAPRADGLHALALLLTALSRSDRTLAEVVQGVSAERESGAALGQAN